MPFEFILTSLVVILIPGTGAIYTMAWGLGGGIRQSILAAFGCTLSITPHVIASILGLAAILHTSALLYEIIKYLGVAWLLYMAWGTLQEKGALQLSEQNEPKSAASIISNGILINVLNPKLSLFFVAFLPQFVDPTAKSVEMSMAALGLTFMILTFSVFVVYGLTASLCRKYVISKPIVMTWLRRVFAATFAGLGLKLATMDQ